MKKTCFGLLPNNFEIFSEEKKRGGEGVSTLGFTIELCTLYH